MAGVKGCGGAGRPSKYDFWLTEDGLGAIAAWKRRGLTNEEVAKNVGVTVKTLYAWAAKYKELCEALKNSKEAAVAIVENKLFENCKKGDNAAIFFYLSNNSNGRYINSKYVNQRVDSKNESTVRLDNNYLKDLSEQIKSKTGKMVVDNLDDNV